MKIVLAVIENSFGIEVVDISANPVSLVGKKVLGVWKIDDGFVQSSGEKKLHPHPGFILTGGEESVNEVDSLLMFLNRGHIPFASEQTWGVSLTGNTCYPKIEQDCDGYWQVVKHSDPTPAPEMGLEIDLF